MYAALALADMLSTLLPGAASMAPGLGATATFRQEPGVWWWAMTVAGIETAGNSGESCSVVSPDLLHAVGPGADMPSRMARNEASPGPPGDAWAARASA